MSNPRSSFAVGDRVKYYDVDIKHWTRGYVHRVNYSPRSTVDRPICGYLINFDNETQGQFSNCNPFVMSVNANQMIFTTQIMEEINMGALYCQDD